MRLHIEFQKILLPQPHCYSYCYLALKLSKISCFKEGFGLNFRCFDSVEKRKILIPNARKGVNFLPTKRIPVLFRLWRWRTNRNRSRVYIIKIFFGWFSRSCNLLSKGIVVLRRTQSCSWKHSMRQAFCRVPWSRK